MFIILITVIIYNYDVNLKDDWMVGLRKSV